MRLTKPLRTHAKGEKPLGLFNTAQEFSNALRHEVASVGSLQERLATLIFAVYGLQREGFPDDDIFNDFGTMLRDDGSCKMC